MNKSGMSGLGLKLKLSESKKLIPSRSSVINYLTQKSKNPYQDENGKKKKQNKMTLQAKKSYILKPDVELYKEIKTIDFRENFTSETEKQNEMLRRIQKDIEMHERYKEVHMPWKSKNRRNDESSQESGRKSEKNENKLKSKPEEKQMTEEEEKVLAKIEKKK